MNREDIIRMAREAGFRDTTTPVVALGVSWEQVQRFAALIAAAEREAILDEWCMCVQSDLENGVKSLNERATEKWLKEYPAISGFDAAIRARGNT
jgi:protein tyrosine phosphatase (PTP) superfamily phosphohydrolase (DUF442 family)